MERGVGPALSEAFYFPYARKIWGIEPVDISAVQASRRVAARSVVDLVRKVLSSVPIIGSRGAGSFYYPRRGYGQISQNLADAAQAAGARLLLKAGDSYWNSLCFSRGKLIRQDMYCSK